MRFEYFQMIDRIVALDLPGRSVRSVGLVPKSSTIFEGHFPNYPLMPGAFLLECMAQTAGWLLIALNGFKSMPFMAGVKDAVKSSAGETKLGQYCVRLNNAYFYEKNYEKSLKYGILASKIFYKQPPAQRPMPFWFFNVNMFMGFDYKNINKYPESEAHLRKAINVADSAPAGQEDWPFHRLCYLELIDALKKDTKLKKEHMQDKQVQQVQEELKAQEAKHK